jgi:hypothetical protein
MGRRPRHPRPCGSGNDDVDHLATRSIAGYDVQSSNLYLKDCEADNWLRPCATACSANQYTSLTRSYIESLGHDILANFGDQYGDLAGGFADQTFKIPNPAYYLP